MLTDRKIAWPCSSVFALLSIFNYAQAEDAVSTADENAHPKHNGQHAPYPTETEKPALPKGMSLDEVLDYSALPPPDHFPNVIHDNTRYTFTIFEQFEFRIPEGSDPAHFGWDAQGWSGRDFDKFWWKHEGQALLEETDAGETETDLLYSRLIKPFWNAQAGLRYANEWVNDEYADTWSAVIGLQGLAPYMFEIDTSLYLSDDGDLSLEFEAEYDQRVTQQLVLQTRAEAVLYAQDIEEKNIGKGLSNVLIDLRIRYEFHRKFAPYIGLRYDALVGETADIARRNNMNNEELFFIGGIRFAF